jgi:hypothetical protein
MEEMFYFDDENSINPNFFNMTNPTLADLSRDNNSNNVGPTPSQINFSSNNNGPHSNHHGLGILQWGQSSNFNDHFSTPLSQQNHHDVNIPMSQQNQHGVFHDTNALSQQNHQQRQGGNNDPFHYNLISPEDNQQGQGGNSDPFQYNLISPENNQQGQGGNNDPLFTNEMSHHGGNNSQSFPQPMVQEQYVQNNNNNFSLGGNNFEVGGTSSQMHENQQQNLPSIQIPVLPNHDQVLAIDQWPPTQLPFFCSCCQVLREIIHTNG